MKSGIYNSNMQLISNKEIIKLESMIEGTEAEELFRKLRRSYNAMFLILQDYKRQIDDLRQENKTRYKRY